MTPTLCFIPSRSCGKSIIEKLNYFIVENEKEARRFIKTIDINLFNKKNPFSKKTNHFIIHKQG